MAVQFNPVSPFALFQSNGPLGFFPNNFAANAGDVPNILWVSSLQTPILNSFSPVFPPLVTNIFGGGPAPLGSAFRPAPLGATPTANGTTGTSLLTPATSVQGGTAGVTGSTAPLTLAGINSLTGANQAALNGLTGTNFAGTNFTGGQIPVAALVGNAGQNNILSSLGGFSALGGLSSIGNLGAGSFGAANTQIPGMMSVGGQAFNGNAAFMNQMALSQLLSGGGLSLIG